MKCEFLPIKLAEIEKVCNPNIDNGFGITNLT